MLAPAFHLKQETIPIIKTIASQKQGIEKLLTAIKERTNSQQTTGNQKRSWLLAEKAYHLIQQKRMAGISKEQLKKSIEASGGAFNLYRFVQSY